MGSFFKGLNLTGPQLNYILANPGLFDEATVAGMKDAQDRAKYFANSLANGIIATIKNKAKEKLYEVASLGGSKLAITIAAGLAQRVAKFRAKRLARVAEEAAERAKNAKAPNSISTGRTVPNSLKEQLAMEEVVANPGGKQLPFKMSDTANNLLAEDGWVKMADNVNGLEIHYVKNTRTGQIVDFKFKD